MTTTAVRRPRLLVVDDDQNLVTLYVEELTEEGYDVVVAGTGTEALARLEDSSPDVVALDIRMPGLDGIETLRAMKARRPRLPVVLNTAYDAYKSEFGSWACDAYVVKSSDLTELKAALRQVLTCGAERSAASGGIGPAKQR